MGKKILSWLMVLAMIFTFIPDYGIVAHATGEGDGVPEYIPPAPPNIINSEEVIAWFMQDLTVNRELVESVGEYATIRYVDSNSSLTGDIKKVIVIKDIDDAGINNANSSVNDLGYESLQANLFTGIENIPAFTNTGNPVKIYYLGNNGNIPVGAFASFDAESSWLKNTKYELAHTKVPVTDIGAYAFYNSGIVNFEPGMLDQITTVNKGILYKAASLSNLVLPNCTKIEQDALYGTQDLSTITLGKLTDVGDNAFARCGVRNIDNGTATITKLGMGAFKECSVLYRIPNIDCAIPEFAFNGCIGLSTIDLSGATAIGPDAFTGCSNLMWVTANKCTSVATGAFTGDSRLRVVKLSNDADVVIAANAFEGISSLETVTGQISKVCDNAFTGCTNLKTVDIDSATSIGEYAFKDCTTLSAIALADGCELKISAFDRCSSITSVTGKPATIGVQAFNACSKLESIDLSETQSIGDRAFYNCVKLNNINLGSCKQIGEYAFGECKGLRVIQLEDVYPTLGNGAFTVVSNSPMRTELYCNSDTVASKIKHDAWRNNYNRDTFWHEFDVECKEDSSAGELPYVFKYTENFHNAAIPGVVGTNEAGPRSCHFEQLTPDYINKSAEGYPEYIETPGTAGIKTVTVSSGCGVDTALVKFSFKKEGESWVLASKTNSTQTDGEVDGAYARYELDNSNSDVTTITVYEIKDAYGAAVDAGSYPNLMSEFELAMKDKKQLVVNIDESITEIPAYFFRREEASTKAKAVTTPTYTLVVKGPEVTMIGEGAFENSAISSPNLGIDFPKLEEIGVNAYRNCQKLSGSVTTPVTLTKLGGGSFSLCNNITAFTGTYVTDLGEGQNFVNCEKLASANVSGATELKGDFSGCTKLTTVSTGLLTSISAGEFQSCTSIRRVDLGNCTEIPTMAFNNCAALTQVDANAVTKIGEKAFERCINIESVELPELKEIGTSAYAGCTKLKSVNASKLVTVGEKAFDKCTALQRVYATPITVKSNAFAGLTNLTEIDLSKAAVIEDSAFAGCNGLAELVLTSATDIGENAFINCSEVDRIEFGSSVPTIAAGAFQYADTLPSKLVRTKVISKDTAIGTKIDADEWKNNFGREIKWHDLTTNVEYHGAGTNMKVAPEITDFYVTRTESFGDYTKTSEDKAYPADVENFGCDQKTLTLDADDLIANKSRKVTVTYTSIHDSSKQISKEMEIPILDSDIGLLSGIYATYNGEKVTELVRPNGTKLNASDFSVYAVYTRDGKDTDLYMSSASYTVKGNFPMSITKDTNETVEFVCKEDPTFTYTVTVKGTQGIGEEDTLESIDVMMDDKAVNGQIIKIGDSEYPVSSFKVFANFYLRNVPTYRKDITDEVVVTRNGATLNPTDVIKAGATYRWEYEYKGKKIGADVTFVKSESVDDDVFKLQEIRVFYDGKDVTATEVAIKRGVILKKENFEVKASFRNGLGETKTEDVPNLNWFFTYNNSIITCDSSVVEFKYVHDTGARTATVTFVEDTTPDKPDNPDNPDDPDDPKDKVLKGIEVTTVTGTMISGATIEMTENESYPKEYFVVNAIYSKEGAADEKVKVTNFATDKSFPITHQSGVVTFMYSEDGNTVISTCTFKLKSQQKPDDPEPDKPTAEVPTGLKIANGTTVVTNSSIELDKDASLNKDAFTVTAVIKKADGTTEDRVVTDYTTDKQFPLTASSGTVVFSYTLNGSTVSSTVTFKEKAQGGGSESEYIPQLTSLSVVDVNTGSETSFDWYVGDIVEWDDLLFEAEVKYEKKEDDQTDSYDAIITGKDNIESTLGVKITPTTGVSFPHKVTKGINKLQFSLKVSGKTKQASITCNGVDKVVVPSLQVIYDGYADQLTVIKSGKANKNLLTARLKETVPSLSGGNDIVTTTDLVYADLVDVNGFSSAKFTTTQAPKKFSFRYPYVAADGSKTLLTGDLTITGSKYVEKPSGSDEDDSANTLSGTFVDHDSKGISGTYVVMDSWSNVVKTDDSGAFKFNNLTEGSHTLYFTNLTTMKSGSWSSGDYTYASLSFKVDSDNFTNVNSTKNDDTQVVVAGGGSNKLTVTVQTADNTVTIKGSIQDSGNTTKSGVTVVLDTYDKKVTSSGSGGFEFRDVANGTHKLYVFNVESDKIYTSGTVSDSAEGLIYIGEISVSGGKVTDTKTIKDGVKSISYSKDSDGKAVSVNITLLGEGETKSDGSSTSSSEGGTQTPATSDVKAFFGIVDAKGAPLAGVSVAVDTYQNFVMTNAQGFAALNNIPIGDHEISIVMENLTGTTKTGAVSNDDAALVAKFYLTNQNGLISAYGTKQESKGFAGSAKVATDARSVQFAVVNGGDLTKKPAETKSYITEEDQKVITAAMTAAGITPTETPTTGDGTSNPNSTTSTITTVDKDGNTITTTTTITQLPKTGEDYLMDYAAANGLVSLKSDGSMTFDRAKVIEMARLDDSPLAKELVTTIDKETNDKVLTLLMVFIALTVMSGFGIGITMFIRKRREEVSE